MPAPTARAARYETSRDRAGRLPRRADTSRGDLSSAQLVGAQLYDANLSGARLWEADLSGARLGGANLSGARLVRTHLSETMGLTQAQLDAARGNATTQLPKELRRPASWTAGQDSAAR